MASTPTFSIELQPGASPPPGITPNFINPPSRAYQVYITAGISLPLMLLFAALRFYATVFLLRSRTKADLVCALGLAAGITYIGLTVGGVSGSPIGKHHWDFRLQDWSEQRLRLNLVTEVIFGPLLWIIKLSLFLMLLDLFGVKKWLRVAVWVGIVVTGLFYLSMTVALLVLCAPRKQTQLAYLMILSTPKCLNNLALILPVGFMNVVSDVYLLLLPLSVLWGLQLPTMKKIGVSAIFLTGSVAVVCSALGLKYRLDEGQSKDTSWTLVSAYIFTIVETAAGFIVSCMPASAAVLRHLNRRCVRLGSQQSSGWRSSRPEAITYGSQTRLNRNEDDEHLTKEVRTIGKYGTKQTMRVNEA